MCRLSGPSLLNEEGPDVVGSEVTPPPLKGVEWSKTETAMEALVLAPEPREAFEDYATIHREGFTLSK